MKERATASDEVAERDDDASGPTSVYLAGEKEATDDKDIYAEFRAAAAEVWGNRGLTREQKKAKVAALKVQRNLKKAGRKARRDAETIKAKKRAKIPKPNTGP